MQGSRGKSSHNLRSNSTATAATTTSTTTIPTNRRNTPNNPPTYTTAATSYHPDEAIFDNTNSFSPMYTSASQSSFGSVNSVTNLQPSATGGYKRIPDN